MKALSSQELEASLRSLASEYDVRAPVLLHDGTRGLGRLDEGRLALCGGALPMPPTAVFFPQIQTELTYENGVIRMQEPPHRPLFVVGFTAQDVECLGFIDRFFAAEYRDDIYFDRRDDAVVIAVSGRCGKNGEFLKIAGGNCDIELVCDGQGFLVVPYSETGRGLCDRIEGGRDAPGFLTELRAESDRLDRTDEELIQRASQLLQADKVPDEFWSGIADRCIACTGCTIVCPTCTCFDVFDWSFGGRVERYRVWDSCQLAGFTREASGHTPLGTEALRTRRRIHHKLAADPARWGQVSCFLCGRCDDVCPTGIGIKAVAREMVERYG